MRRSSLSNFLITIFIFIGAFTILSVIAPAQQWSTPVRISEFTGGYYPDILACGETLHVAYQSTQRPWKVEYVRSTDGGRSWGNRRVLSDTINTSDTWHPHVMQYNSTLLAVWEAYFLHGVYRNDIAYCFSHNGGVSWTAPQYILDPNLPMPFRLTASAADSIVNIMFSMSEVDSMGFYCVRSTDFGENWSYPRRLFRIKEGGMGDLAQSQDFVHAIWSGRFTMQRPWETYCLRSTDGGINWWGNAMVSDSDLYHSYLPAIAADGDAGVALTWMDRRFSPYITGDVFLRRSTNHGETWGPEIQITFDHFSDGSDIIVSGDTLHVVWENVSGDYSDRAIKYTRSTDGGISWETPMWIDRTEDDSHSPVLGTSLGRVYVLWYDDGEPPDSAGVYFSRWPAEPDAAGDGLGTAMPASFALSAYPNPFNAATTITVAGMEEAEIAIFDIAGRMVATLHAEHGRAVWQAQGMSSGVYFARAVVERSEGQTGASAAQTIKLVYLK